MSKTACIVLALAAGLASAWLSYQWQSATGTSDLHQRLCAARELLDGRDPYAGCYTEYNGKRSADYPLTTIIALAPLARLPYTTGASVFWGAANALLVFGILRSGKRYHLFLFLSGQYWLAFIWQQFSLLLAAVYLLPALMPLALLKPQLGLAVFLARPSRLRAAACAAFVALTFAVYPGWVDGWRASAVNFDGVIPLLTAPLGPLLALSALRIRDPGARLLLFTAAAPQRVMADLVPLFLLARSLRQTLIVSILSWVPALMWMAGKIPDPQKYVIVAIPCIYLPVLASTLRLYGGDLAHQMSTRLRRPVYPTNL